MVFSSALALRDGSRVDELMMKIRAKVLCRSHRADQTAQGLMGWVDLPFVGAE